MFNVESRSMFFFFNDTATTEIYTLSLHDALPISGRARIVIVGCGFGGLFAARALERAAADVLVIDRNNYHLFQPLLYQVASAALAPADIAQPIRTILRPQKNARVMLAEVQRVDLASRSLDTAVGRVPYDYLILAPGAVDEYFGHEEWRRFAPGMKEVGEATFIRSRLLRSFEIAEGSGEGRGGEKGRFRGSPDH